AASWLDAMLAGGADRQLNGQSAAVAAIAIADKVNAAGLAVAAATSVFNACFNVHFSKSAPLATRSSSFYTTTSGEIGSQNQARSRQSLHRSARRWLLFP